MADMFDKEELNIVGGLFPNTLAVAEAERQAQQEAAFKRYSGGGAAQNPLALLSGLSGMFGTAAGQELRGLGGFQSPTVQLSSIREQARKQFDTNTPEGLVQYAQFLNQNGDPSGARQAVMLAQAQAQRMATLEKTGAETTAKLREPLPNIAKLQAYRTNLVSQFGENDPRVKAVDKVIAAEGEGKGTKIINDLAGVFNQAFTKQEAEKQADDWAKAGQAYADASALARNVREMESVVGNAFVGSYGSLLAGVSRAFGGGKRLNDTEVFDALSAQLVLPLAKLLPGSLAVKELDQLIKTKPNLKQQEGTIRRLLNTINQDLRASEISYEAGERYRAANNGKIAGFNPYIAKNKATRFTELEAIYKSGKKLTDAQKSEAQKLAKELQLEGL